MRKVSVSGLISYRCRCTNYSCWNAVGGAEHDEHGAASRDCLPDDRAQLASPGPKATSESPTKRRKGKGSKPLMYRLSSPYTPTAFLSQEEKNVIITHIHAIIHPFILRRLKKDVAKDLPPKIEKVVFCPLSPLQCILYDLIKIYMDDRMDTIHQVNGLPIAPDILPSPSGNSTRYSREVQRLVKHAEEFIQSIASQNESSLDDSESIALDASWRDLKLNNIIVQLRKLCNHPYLILDPIRRIDDNQYFRELINSSGKMMAFHALLSQLLAENRKVGCALFFASYHFSPRN